MLPSLTSFLGDLLDVQRGMCNSVEVGFTTSQSIVLIKTQFAEVVVSVNWSKIHRLSWVVYSAPYVAL